MLESAKEEDKCLLCGGDGSTCYSVKGTFDVPSLPKGTDDLDSLAGEEQRAESQAKLLRELVRRPAHSIVVFT